MYTLAGLEPTIAGAIAPYAGLDPINLILIGEGKIH
jgi:hypothetical protein